MPYTITAEQLETIWEMPALNHYPNRDRPFNFADSEVVAFLMRALDINLADGCRAFERLRRHRDILYDPTIKRWVGKSLMAPAKEEA